MDPERKVEFFSTFVEENQAEYIRRANMTPEEIFREFSALQERAWGKSWTLVPIKKIATCETVSW